MLLNIITWLNENIIWGAPMLALFIGVGVFFTVKLRFFQLNLVKIFKETLFRKNNESGEASLSPFQTLTASLAVTIGTGNIVALGTAIALGGAGAVFWMWFSAVIGMATTYAENYLGMKYRRARPTSQADNSGKWRAGAFYYIEAALGKFPAKAFAFCCMLASIGIGNMTQINAMSVSMKHSFNTPLWLSGLIAVIPVGALIFGGALMLGKVTEKAIPVMSLIYIIGCTAVIIVNIRALPACFLRIITEAFSLKAIGGGAAGFTMSKAMSWGFRRGIFSNEAGLGSSVMLNGLSASDNPRRQSLWATLTVFFDTIVICSLTAFAILLTGADKTIAAVEGDGVNLASAAFGSAFGSGAGVFVTLSIVFFAISTAAGWSVYGVTCTEYLYGKKAVKPFLILFTAFSFVGAIMKLEFVWGAADLMNGLMAVPNLLAIMILGLRENEQVTIDNGQWTISRGNM